MSENIMGKIENYKESVKRYIEEDLQRNQNEKNEAEKERKSLERIIDINDRDENVLYQRNLKRLKNADTTITNTKRAAKCSIEQLITLLKERNQELATNYMSKKPGQIQLEINWLETENQRLEFEITHKLQVIEQTQQLIEKYAEMGDYDRKTELESKVSGLRTEITEIRNQQKSNSDKINTCKNYEEEYEENTELIKDCRNKAKKYGIELEEKQTESKDREKPESKDGEKPEPKAGEKPEPKAGEKPEPKAGEKPEPKDGEKPEPKVGEKPEPKVGEKAEPKVGEKPEPRVGEKTTPIKEPINRMEISVSTKGTKIDIYRGKGAKSEIDWANTHRNKNNDGRTELDKDLLKGIQTRGELKEAYDKALEKGDKFIVREMLRAAYDKRITIDEAKKQLRTYTEILEGKKEPTNEDNQLSISYDLRRLRKSGLSKEERKELVVNAKKARDLGLVEKENIKAPLLVNAQWIAQDIGKWFSRNEREKRKELREAKKHERLCDGKTRDDNTQTTDNEKGKITPKQNVSRPGELESPEAKKQQQEAAAKVAIEHQNTTKASTVDEKMSASIQNDVNKTEGVEPDKD